MYYLNDFVHKDDDLILEGFSGLCELPYPAHCENKVHFLSCLDEVHVFLVVGESS